MHTQPSIAYPITLSKNTYLGSYPHKNPISRSLSRSLMEMASVSSNPRTVEEIFKDFSGRRNGIIRALTYGTRSRFLFIFFSFIFGHFYLSIYLTFFLISQISSPLRCGRVLCALRSRYFFRHASLNPFVCFYGFVISWMMGDLSLCGDLNRANQFYCYPSLLARI